MNVKYSPMFKFIILEVGTFLAGFSPLVYLHLFMSVMLLNLKPSGQMRGGDWDSDCVDGKSFSGLLL